MECASPGNPTIETIVSIIALIREKAGDDGIALAIFAATSIGLVLSMNWVNALAVPPIVKLVNNFLQEQLDKARRLFEDNKQDRFQGIRLVTVQVAVVLGFACYLWTKVAIKIPYHWPWTLGLLLLLVFGFVVVGRWYSPRLKFRGYRLLFLSAGGGIALGTATILLDAITALLALGIAFVVSLS